MENGCTGEFGFAFAFAFAFAVGALFMMFDQLPLVLVSCYVVVGD